jgi:hypothetical protein
MNRKSLPYKTFSFSLPVGLVDAQGILHREGVMRMATGNDELCLQQDSRFSDNPTYGVLLMLSQVILHLGSLSPLTPELLESLFLPDLNYLQAYYNQINPPEGALSLLGE